MTTVKQRNRAVLRASLWLGVGLLCWAGIVGRTKAQPLQLLEARASVSPVVASSATGVRSTFRGNVALGTIAVGQIPGRRGAARGAGGSGNIDDADAEKTGRTGEFAEMFLTSDDPIGTAIIWLLLIMSAMSMGYALKLLSGCRRQVILPAQIQDQVSILLAEKCYREAIDYVQADDSFLGNLVSGALLEASCGFSAMQRAIEETADARISRMLRPVEYLNVLGNIAPMLGLFGTVYGMIMAFQQLVAAGGKPNPAQLAAGISTALVTTFWGLVVAIPSLAAYAIVRNKIDALTSEAVMVAEELIRPFKPSSIAPKTSATPSVSQIHTEPFSSDESPRGFTEELEEEI